MGTVYVARVRGAGGFQRFVALKVLHAHLAEEEDFVSMFLDEARLAARIHHPNVVATIDVIEEPELAIVMELAVGAHLGALARRARRTPKGLAAPVALRIVIDALAGLAAAHELTDERGKLLGLVHRDISPQNILVGADGMTRLTDFGVARAEARLTSTRDGSVKGKLGYMAPEQATGGAVDHRADLFSMSVVLWEALAGRRLFAGETDVEIAQRVSSAPIPPISAIVPTLAPLDAALARALARDPEARFASARDMAAAIEDCGVLIASQRAVGETVRALAGDLLEPLREALASSETRPPAELTTPTRSPPSDPHGGGVADELTRPISKRSLAPAVETQEAPPTTPAVASPPTASAALPARRTGALWAFTIAIVLVSIGGATWLGGATAPRASPSVEREATLLQGNAPHAPEGAAILPTIALRVHVTSDGRVDDAQVQGQREERRELERLALDAVRGWRFSPAVSEGREVAAWLSIPVTFEPALSLAGVVHVMGSDTLGATLLPELGRSYHAAHPSVRIDVEALGSSTAFVGLFDGSADVGAASRPIRPDEVEEASRLGLVLHELQLGWDGVAVIVHPARPLDAIDLPTLRAIYRGQPVSPELGRFHVITRPEQSGTHAFFGERVLGAGVEPPSDAITIEHNEEIVRYVASDPLAIAYLGVGFVTPEVRVVALRDAAGVAHRPEPDAISDGSYPLSRPLLLYLPEQPTPPALDFVRFLFSNEGRRTIAAHGFVAVESAPRMLADLAAAEAPADHAPLRLSFAPGVADIDTSAADALTVWLRAHHEDRVVVQGHASEDEPDAEALASRRAEAVAALISESGVDASRVTTAGLGARRPIGPLGSDTRRRLGRRAEVFALPAR